MAGTDPMEDPNRTGRFRLGISGPGGVKAWAEGKGAVVFFAGATLVLLVWGGMFLVEQRLANDQLNLRLSALALHVREIRCLLALPDEDRRRNPGLSAACRAAGEQSEGAQR